MTVVLITVLGVGDTTQGDTGGHFSRWVVEGHSVLCCTYLQSVVCATCSLFLTCARWHMYLQSTVIQSADSARISRWYYRVDGSHFTIIIQEKTLSLN